MDIHPGNRRPKGLLLDSRQETSLVEGQKLLKGKTRALHLLALAVTEDERKNYETALELYRMVIGMLLEQIGVEKDRKKSPKRKELRRQVDDLLRRAEQIKNYLSEEEKRCCTNCKCRPDPEPATRKPASEGEKKEDFPNSTTVAEEENLREWTFKFDVNFQMNSKIKTPSTTPKTETVGPAAGLLSKVMSLLRSLLGDRV